MTSRRILMVLIICGCSLLALSLTGCGGESSSGNGLPVERNDPPPPPEEGPGTHSYRLTNPQMGFGCLPLTLFLGCNTPANCMKKIGLATTGYMDVSYTETTVLIEIIDPLSGSATIPLIFAGTRTPTGFSAPFTTSMKALNCDASVQASVTGGDITAESFSGTISARVVVSNCGIFDADCQLSANYTAQRYAVAVGESSMEQRLNLPVEYEADSPEEALDQLRIILESLFLME